MHEIMALRTCEYLSSGLLCAQCVSFFIITEMLPCDVCQMSIIRLYVQYMTLLAVFAASSAVNVMQAEPSEDNGE